MDSSNLRIEKRPSPPRALEDHIPEKIIRYKECLKNHAAAIGGNATDGCGEFMPAGDEGTLDALKCSACNCHRNFHRKEIIDFDSECCPTQYYFPSLLPNTAARAKPDLLHLSPNKSGSNPPDQPEVKDEHDEDGVTREVEKSAAEKVTRKRFRTKFTQDQKEKMQRFAEKAGWRMQRLEESVVQQFCQEIGIKGRVLKVWMHNNKNTFANRNLSTN